jgi:NADH-quinone oxidoreductase subunit M
MLTLYRRTVFGQITNPELNELKDMNRIELVTIVPLALLTLLFGVAPNLIFNLTEGATQSILSLMAGG